MAIDSPAASTRDTTDSQAKSTPKESVVDLIKEWQDARIAGKTLTNTAEPLQVDFSNPIYHNSMNADLNQFNADAQNKTPDAAALTKDLAAVGKDATWWENHDKGDATTSPVTADLKKQMADMSKAVDLIKQGKTQEGLAMLNGSRSDVTDDLATLEKADWLGKHGGSGGGGGGGGTNPMKDETSYKNMQSSDWRVNSHAGEIGGKGINPNFDITHNADGSMTAKFSGGAWTDGLLSKTEAYNPKDNTVQMNYKENIANGSNINALENDIAITGSDGKTAMAASQWVINKKNGTAELDLSDTQHHWVKAATVALPKDGEFDVNMQVKLVGDTYEYTGVTLNGQNVALDPSATKFESTQIGPKGWAKDTIVTQLQQDLLGNGGSSTVNYKQVEVDQGNT